MLSYASVCSGIEAVTAAWHPLGMTPAWFAEIEPFPSAVPAHHYPQVQNHSDITRLDALVLAGKIKAPAVLVGAPLPSVQRGRYAPRHAGPARRPHHQICGRRFG